LFAFALEFLFFAEDEPVTMNPNVTIFLIGDRRFGLRFD